jgi:quercetin dioxygenase-like cupin family protein
MKPIAYGFTPLVATVVVGAALAAGQPLVKATPLAAASLHQSYSISVRNPAEIVVVKVTVPPGGSFGWHSHPSAVAVAITSGTLTLYDPSYPNCGPRRFTRGQGFVELPDHVHLARNEGTAPVTLYATYLGVPHDASPNLPARTPAHCPA